MSASHPQAHIGLPAICTAKLVIIYLKTVVFNEKYSEKWHLPDAYESVRYHRRSRFAHPRLICNLIPSVYINSFSLNTKKPRDFPRSICSFVLMSKYGLCRRHITAYLNGTHPTAYHLYRAINYPVTLNEARKGLLSITKTRNARKGIVYGNRGLSAFGLSVTHDNSVPIRYTVI